jgi:hypothetical protein
MNLKRICLSGLVVALVGVAGARGEPPTGRNGLGAMDRPAMSDSASPPPAAAPAPLPGAQPQSSDWIVGCRGPLCCGPIGADGPIGQEFFVRSGVVFPIGGGALNSALDPGWAIETGTRTLFFGREVDDAWTVELSVANFNNTSGDRTTTHPLFNIPVKTAQGTITVDRADVASKSFNQTFVNLAGGREWWLWGPATCGGDQGNWRAGVDLGGRYGTAKLELVQPIGHKTDVLGGFFVAAHSDVEIPWNHFMLMAGIRAEYGYTWSDILQRQNNSDVQNLNLLFTLGARF